MDALAHRRHAVRRSRQRRAARKESQRPVVGGAGNDTFTGGTSTEQFFGQTDVAALMTALSNLPTYQGSLTNVQLAEIADLTSDNLVNNKDVQGLIVLLANGGGSGPPGGGTGAVMVVPEPSSFVILLVGALAFLIHSADARKLTARLGAGRHRLSS